MEGKTEDTLIKKIQPQDIFKNNGKEGKPLWIVIHDKVYDITNFAHPGGKEVFIIADEDDMDKGDEFDSIHAPASKKQADKYLIGELEITAEKKERKIQNKAKANASSNGMFVVFVVFLVIIIIVVKGGYLSGGETPQTLSTETN